MLNVLSGWQTANIKSFPIALETRTVGGEEKTLPVELLQGDWVVFDTNGDLIKQTGTYTGNVACFPVYAGNVSFFDTRYHNRADVVTADSAVLETDGAHVDATGIKAGASLTIKDGKVSEATATDQAVIGYAIKNQAADGTLQFALA